MFQRGREGGRRMGYSAYLGATNRGLGWQATSLKARGGETG